MDEELDALFALPPGEFTAARDALVNQLRAEKRGDEAAAVKALRRPTVPAWTVNMVARNQPDVVDALVAAGTALAGAQRRALSGVKEAGMREAAQQRREAVDRAWLAAAAILRDADTDPAPHRQAVSDTFEAATADPEAATTVREGRLSKELPPPAGFGAVTGFSVVPNEADAAVEERATPAETGAQARSEDAGDPAEDDRVEQAAREARRKAEIARQRADEAQARAQGAQRRSGDARQAALRATAEAERLEARAQAARTRADELTDKAHGAERDATQAQAEAQQLVEAAAAAEAAAGG